MRMSFSCRKCHSKHGPSMFFALNANLSMMGSYEALGNGKTQSRPSCLPAARFVHAVKPVKYMGNVFCGNSLAAIFYGNIYRILLRSNFNGNLVRTVLQSIVEENIEHLFYFCLIGHRINVGGGSFERLFPVHTSA